MAAKGTTHFKLGLVHSIKMLRDKIRWETMYPLGLGMWSSVRAVLME